MWVCLCTHDSYNKYTKIVKYLITISFLSTRISFIGISFEKKLFSEWPFHLVNEYFYYYSFGSSFSRYMDHFVDVDFNRKMIKKIN